MTAHFSILLIVFRKKLHYPSSLFYGNSNEHLITTRMQTNERRTAQTLLKSCLIGFYVQVRHVNEK